MTTHKDIVGEIMEYEEGGLTIARTLKLFGELIRSGMAWSLQGHYGRMATGLIEHGLLTKQGEITEAGHAAIYESEEDE